MTATVNGTATPPPAAATQTVLTRRPGTVLRRSVFWIAGTVFVVVIAVIGLLLAGSASVSEPLSATNPAPIGAKALVEVLKQQGVDVTVASSLAEAQDAVADANDTTLFLYDSGSFLTDEQLSEAAGLAAHVVVVDPGFDALLAIAPEIAQAGYVGDELASDCDVDAVRKAGTVSGEASGYRVVDDSAEVTACLGSGDDVYSLVQLERDGSTLPEAASGARDESDTSVEFH